MTPLILIPAYQYIDWRLQGAIAGARIPVMHVHGCSDLVKVRSQMLSDALRSTADRFLFIDSDIIPTSEQIRALAESERLDAGNAVTGGYVGRDGQLAAQLAVQEPITLDGGPRFQPCLAAGMGFSAVHRATIERLRAELPELTTETGVEWRAYFLPQVLRDPEITGEQICYFSEDWAFWWRVRKLAGASFWLDTKLLVGHLRSTPYSLDPSAAVEPHGRFPGKPR